MMTQTYWLLNIIYWLNAKDFLGNRLSRTLDLFRMIQHADQQQLHNQRPTTENTFNFGNYGST